jgi:hypothetical protein
VAGLETWRDGWKGGRQPLLDLEKAGRLTREQAWGAKPWIR